MIRKKIWEALIIISDSSIISGLLSIDRLEILQDVYGKVIVVQNAVAVSEPRFQK